MKAVIYERYGPPDVMRIAEVPKPEPKDNEVLIRVRAAEATKADCELRAFRFAVNWFWLPLRLGIGVFRPRRQILGNYFAGEVVERGAGVTRLAVGDEVYGGLGLHMGAYGDTYATTPNVDALAAKGLTYKYAWSTAPVCAPARTSTWTD